jgi:hypothetical protein
MALSEEIGQELRAMDGRTDLIRDIHLDRIMRCSNGGPFSLRIWKMREL